MLLTSWVRAFRQKVLRRRSLPRARRSTGSARPLSASQVHLPESLEERTLLSALVIDAPTAVSTTTTPGINITNSTLDANNDGISDFDNLVIASSDVPISVTGTGIGIKINLSGLTGLDHITIENVTVTGGASFQGIDIDLNNVRIESLTVDQTTVTTTNADGININLQNIGTTGGADVTVKDSTVRSTGAAATGVNVILGSTSAATHLDALTFADSTIQGIGVTSTATAPLQTLIDQAVVKNARVQDAANVAAGITYYLTRTTVDDLRVEDNPHFRNLNITATNSPLHAVTIDNNTNIDLTSNTVAAGTTGIAITATSNSFATSERSDVTNLQIVGNTIQGSAANTNTVNGIVLNLTDSNLGSFANNLAGATITNNTLRNLVSSAA